jgi:hypothetical protein
MAKSEIEEIGDALPRLATPDMSVKELLRAVRERFPKASKKTIVRAAFYSVIANTGSEADVETARRLQDFALKERTDE